MIEFIWVYYAVMRPNDTDGMVYSVDPGQTAALEAVWFSSAGFALSICPNT